MSGGQNNLCRQPCMHDFRVEADAAIIDVTLTAYFNEQTKHVHTWYGSLTSSSFETEHQPSTVC
ncbi:hypothetical protein Pyn_22620 [Prunus yedoensis var. nudiflora]|uniref:Methylcrotonoyl-CoA carboxylase subunit alpha BT domain-containing protein n=1 Tax=Prunus yedoensis var. nudiflora TaxID=2094558 RepID=A0A314ZK59_PRUYE|nr:hypothetical protein Pyn_22620 [Prunus yedoensis var. nudiflora]